MGEAPRVLEGILGFLLLSGLIVALHALIPGRWVEGYVRDESTRELLQYRLNGLRVMAATLFLGALAGRQGWVAPDWLWTHRWHTLGTAVVLGLLFTAAVVLPAPPVRGLVADLYLGRLKNPQWLGGRLDAKMVLYLYGAVVLLLNLLGFAAHHSALYPGATSPGVWLYVMLFGFFLCEYLFFEEVHLYTYDFVAERVGFKLGWGCLCFYPFFYGVGLWSVAELPDPGHSTLWLVAAALVFFSGWCLARGANLQKYWFKRDPTHVAFGVLVPRALERDGRRVLISGFWGLSRHVNYLGEILMATGLTLALGHPAEPLPWLYPLYYVALLVPRQLDDDRRCAATYGPLWDEYRRAVPWRIVPYVY